MFNHAVNLSLRSYICANSIQNTLVRIMKTISCIQNVTWKCCREKFRFLGQLNGCYYHKSWYFRPKNDLGLMAGTYGSCSKQHLVTEMSEENCMVKFLVKIVLHSSKLWYETFSVVSGWCKEPKNVTAIVTVVWLS